MFCFDDPPKLQLPFQTSQQINRSPTGEKWAKRHSEPTHPPDMPTQIFPVFFKSQFQVGVLFNQNMWCKWKETYWEHFWCTWNVLASPEILKSVVTFHPPKRNRCRCPVEPSLFFFGAAGSVAPWTCWGDGFFSAQPLGIWYESFLSCVNVNDIFVAVSLAIHMGTYKY